MASGHVNRIKRPDTWLHRPMLQNVKKVLANPEPSTHGTKRTYRVRSVISAFRGKAENICSQQVFPPLTLAVKTCFCQGVFTQPRPWADIAPLALLCMP